MFYFDEMYELYAWNLISIYLDLQYFTTELPYLFPFSPSQTRICKISLHLPLPPGWTK